MDWSCLVGLLIPLRSICRLHTYLVTFLCTHGFIYPYFLGTAFFPLCIFQRFVTRHVIFHYFLGFFLSLATVFYGEAAHHGETDHVTRTSIH